MGAPRFEQEEAFGLICLYRKPLDAVRTSAVIMDSAPDATLGVRERLGLKKDAVVQRLD